MQYFKKAVKIVASLGDPSPNPRWSTIVIFYKQTFLYSVNTHYSSH